MAAQKNSPVLCYIDLPWAYFTTQALENQDGDDWHKRPYEHNAGPPDSPSSPEDWNTDGITPKWEIIKVAFEGDFNIPCDYHYNSPFSVNDINSGAIAWLRSEIGSEHKVIISAGTSLDDFIKLVKEAGGKVYTEVWDDAPVGLRSAKEVRKALGFKELSEEQEARNLSYNFFGEKNG